MMKSHLLALGLLSFTSSFSAFSGELSNQAILYVGDSISYGNFGTTLDNDLRQLSSNVTFISSCGTSPSNWLTSTSITSTVCGFWIHTPTHESRSGRTQTETPKIATELREIRPAVTIVQLGTNMASGMPSESTENYKENAKYVREVAQVTEMMQTIKQGGSQCMWITPPNGIEVDESLHLSITMDSIKTTRDLIDEVASKEGCIAIDTLVRSIAPGGNNVHPAKEEAGQWGEAVFSTEPFVSEIRKALNSAEARNPASVKKKKSSQKKPAPKPTAQATQ